ncbi:MAG: 2-isopropylmalate synthase [Spirochaetales bacterium]|uniref:2-isopropylmalate synthase n=1 Tax=Candidatus Thalassospirochaeta sargassi TaxID=3119039 RepID=A0AAJ1MKP7_9SPIO|nr:2-isopropylmalate synthase [Spirochaetales bacterium]
MRKIEIFDTTLRDGEQAPGASMTIEQKYEFGLQLSRLGVDVIEAGFPVSSPQQFEACKLIADNVKGSVIAGLARAVEKDIDAVHGALKGAETSRLHTFIATSPIHMEYKLKMTPDQVVENAVKAVTYARNKFAQVEFSPEDGTRSELEFLYRIIEAVIDAGATVINVPDTVGYTMPDEIGHIFSSIMNNVPNIDKAILSTHNHNDLGMGVANTLSAIKNGAGQAEVSMNGIGERAGNAALEELVMALEVRKDLHEIETNIDTKQLFYTSKMLSTIIASPIPRNKPITGANAFSHESGIHQHGMLSHRETYEIMTPESVGREDSEIILGRHSGLHGFSKRVKELGLTLNEEQIGNAFKVFLSLADRKKEVFDEDILQIAGSVLGKKSLFFELDYFNVTSGNAAIPTATVRIKFKDEATEEAATGDGPISAIFQAIDKATGLTGRLEEFHVNAITAGKQAIGEVSVVVNIKGNVYNGKGSSTDILKASARAYISALNRYKLALENAGA